MDYAKEGYRKWHVQNIIRIQSKTKPKQGFFSNISVWKHVRSLIIELIKSYIFEYSIHWPKPIKQHRTPIYYQRKWQVLWYISR